MTEIREISLGGQLWRALIYNREITKKEYESMSDINLAFLLGIKADDPQLLDYKIAIENTLYRKPESKIALTDKGAEIEKEIKVLQKKLDKEYKPK
jgi:hypothetical protein